MAGQVILSPLIGVVLRLEATVGDALAEGATLMVVESMKMDIPVAMPKAGRLTALSVAAGDAISEGQELGRYD